MIYIILVETTVGLYNLYRYSSLFEVFHNALIIYLFILAHDFILHTRKFITRIYPKGTRTDSSNFNPQEFWNLGCQMGMLYRILRVFMQI